MKILLVPIGSYGDVQPFMGLGLELKSRGHEIVMIANGHFRRTAEAIGFTFVENSTEADYLALLNNELLWHPTKGFPYYVKHVLLPLVRPTYEIVREHYRSGATIAVSSSHAFGARLAQEKLGVPLAVIHLEPSAFRSVYDLPLFADVPRLSAWMPISLRHLVLRLKDVLIDRILAPGINEVRSDLQLPPINRVVYRWWDSPELTLGLFPDWYGPPQKDWPPSARVTGFPLFDAAAEMPGPPGLLDDLKGGRAPIVFTAGSAMRVGQAFFRESAHLCERLNRPGLLLTPFPEQLPALLPRGVRHASYAPYSQVFPLAAVVVHHGGIGTTALAFRAGVPQLIVPMAYDQPENARRVERLGAGLSLNPSRYHGPEAETLLSRLISEPAWSERCRAIAMKFTERNPVKDSCDLIERLGETQ